jgi:hypothetical protein
MRRKDKRRNSPRRAGAPKTKAREFQSSLYDRANGFMLGCFLTLVRYRFARDSFQFHRLRMGEFLHEAGIKIKLPASQGAYDSQADKLLQDAVLACRERSAELADFVLLGGVATIDASLRLSEEPVIEDLRDTATGVLRRHNLDGKALYDRFLAYVRKSDDDAKEEGLTGVRIETFLTPAMDLLTTTIEPLGADSSLCFVAMPFKSPYARYFDLLYRPLASALDCGAFRMWGGLSGEAYVDLMLAIMRRCKIVIADLSDVNPNVLYEFGVARGLEKRVVPLCQRAYAGKLPSNIGSDTMLQLYSPREQEWPTGTVLRCAAQVSLVDFSRELAERQVAGARWEEGGRLPQLPKDEGEGKAAST